jgi:hypothetical protein
MTMMVGPSNVRPYLPTARRASEVVSWLAALLAVGIVDGFMRHLRALRLPSTRVIGAESRAD